MNPSAPADVSCPVCAAPGAVDFLRRPSVPAEADRAWPCARGARQCPRGDLVFHVCRGCGFVFNTAFDPALAAVPEAPRPEARGDILIDRDMIGRVPNPVEWLRSIRGTLADGTATRLFVETPNVNFTLARQAAWDFQYAMCSLFTPEALTEACQRAGFAVTALRRVFDGQSLWLEATAATARATEMELLSPTVGLAWVMHRDANVQARTWREQVDRHRAAGPVAVWGAGSRAATFCHLVDAESGRIDCIADENGENQGQHLAGTGHPIVAPEHLAKRGVATVLVLNAHAFADVTAQLANEGSAAAAVDLVRAA